MRPRAGPRDWRPRRPAREPTPWRLDRSHTKAIVEATLHTTLGDATDCRRRTPARVRGETRMLVARIWQALGLPPRRVRTFGLSGDAAFEEKLTGVVGLYLSPPDMALGLCGNEKNVRFMQPR